MSGRSKTTMAGAEHAIAPYIHYEMFRQDYVNIEDLQKIFMRLSRFSNVEAGMIDRHDGYLYLHIVVHSLLWDREKTYEVRTHGRRKQVYDPLRWIDEIEKWDILLR